MPNSAVYNTDVERLRQDAHKALDALFDKAIREAWHGFIGPHVFFRRGHPKYVTKYTNGNERYDDLVDDSDDVI